MANWKKAAGEKVDASIILRCSGNFKKDVDAMAAVRFGEGGTEQGSLSSLVRDFLAGEVERFRPEIEAWKASQQKKEAE